MAAANWHSDLDDLGISLEQVMDHAATTSRVDREISVTFSSACRRPAQLPAVADCPAHVVHLYPLAILIFSPGFADATARAPAPSPKA